MTMIEAAIDTMRAVQDELLASEAVYIRLGGGEKKTEEHTSETPVT